MKDIKTNSTPWQRTPPPRRRPLLARPEVGGERRRKQTPRPAAPPPQPPPGQARSRQREAYRATRYKPKSTYVQQYSGSGRVPQQQQVLFLCHSRRASRQLARRKAEGVGPLLSMPGFFFFPARSGTVCNITPETATEQSILEIASRSSKSQPQQQSFQPSLHPSSCQGA